MIFVNYWFEIEGFVDGYSIILNSWKNNLKENNLPGDLFEQFQRIRLTI